MLTVIAGKAGGLAHAGDAPLHAVIGGGLVGALYVGSIVWTIRALGVTGLSAATLAGQFARRAGDRPLRLARRGPVTDYRVQARRVSRCWRQGPT